MTTTGGAMEHRIGIGIGTGIGIEDVIDGIVIETMTRGLIRAGGMSGHRDAIATVGAMTGLRHLAMSFPDLAGPTGIAGSVPVPGRVQRWGSSSAIRTMACVSHRSFPAVRPGVRGCNEAMFSWRSTAGRLTAPTKHVG